MQDFITINKEMIPVFESAVNKMTRATGIAIDYKATDASKNSVTLTFGDTWFNCAFTLGMYYAREVDAMDQK